MTRILVTGATGFIGRQLLTSLGNYRLRLAGRAIHRTGVQGITPELTEFDLGKTDNDFTHLLKDVDVVIHLAGIAHTKPVAVSDYVQKNAVGTARLAEAAANLGVKRFIFLSTIKVHGESTPMDHGLHTAITELTPPAPQDPYSKSKLEAEHTIISACHASNMEYVILRPPLVYGPGVKANFLKLLQAASWRLPMPFTGINNRRSLIYVENLCDIIRRCADQPVAANQIYVLKDYDDSTVGLFTKLSLAFGHNPRLFNVAPDFLKLLGKVLYMDNAISRLTESMLVDNTKLTTQLGWSACVDTASAMQSTVDWYRHRNS